MEQYTYNGIGNNIPEERNGVNITKNVIPSIWRPYYLVIVISGW